MKRILVTGASGFIGSHLTRRLLEEGHEVHLVSRPKSHFWRIQSLLPHICVHLCDLANFERLFMVLQEVEPDVIFHCAVSRGDDLELIQGNIIGSFNLLKASRDIDYEYFLHMGGSLEYGLKDIPHKETDPLKPLTFYGATKACASILAEQFALQEKKPLSILRPFSVYGPLEDIHRLVPKVIHAALFGSELKLTAPGFSRDFVYVEDVVEACLQCWKQGIVRETLNVGFGVQATNEEVVQQVESITGQVIIKDIGAYTPHLTDTNHWVADLSKLQRLLNWQPCYTLKQGLEKTIEYARHQHCSAHL